MKKIFLIALIAFSFSFSFAQENEEKRQKIEAAKIGFITNKLDLKPGQAEKFWPVYNEFSDKRNANKEALKQLKDQDRTNATDEEIRKDLKSLLEIKQKELNLEKEYQDKFLKVLSPKQTIELLKAEREFMTIVYRKMMKEGKEKL